MPTSSSTASPIPPPYKSDFHTIKRCIIYSSRTAASTLPNFVATSFRRCAGLICFVQSCHPPRSEDKAAASRRQRLTIQAAEEAEALHAGNIQHALELMRQVDAHLEFALDALAIRA